MTSLVVVTGGSSGLGRALLERTPIYGAVRVDVSRSGGVPGTEHVALDLADPAAWPRFGEWFEGRVGELDPERVVVIHNAGVIEPIGFAGEVDAEAYAANVLLNAAAGQVIGHHVLAALAGRGGRGTLCMISSGAARRSYPGWSAYCAGKAALEHWVRTVGEEQQQRGGVEVCAVAPGVVDTPMQTAIRATAEHDFPAVQRFHDLHGKGDLRDPEYVAAQLWQTLEDGVPPGAVLDLRDR